jgi:hypothetical protein
MGGIITPPPSEGGGLPSIPVPDFTQQAQQTVAGLQQAGFWQDFFLALWTSVVPGIQVVVGVLVRLMEFVATQALTILQAAQGANSPQFFQLCAAVVSDLLGFQVGEAMSQPNMTVGGSLGPYFQVGKQFLDAITGEMNPNNASGPQAGYNAATQWLGRAIGFAIREGNVENFLQMLPQELRFFEGLRGYGVNMAQALGLGRLTHEALRGYMKVMVSDPLTYYLNNLTHPTMLSRDEIIKAWFRGMITDETSAQWLSWLGYSSDLTAFIRAINKWIPSDTSVVAGWRLGELDLSQYNTQIVAREVDPQDIQLFDTFATYARAESHLNSAISNYITLLKNRWITAAQFEAQLAGLGVTALELKWAEQEVFPLLNFRTKELTQAEIIAAYEAGLVDLSYYTDWMVRMGYAPSDQAVLQYQLLLKEEKAVSADQIAAWKLRIQCLDAKAKAQPLPPGFDSNCNPTS